MKKKNVLVLCFSAFALVISFISALMLGSYRITPVGIFHALFLNDGDYSIQRSIILNLRLPRTLIACFSGIALSLSGILYQELFQNKLVSPDLLGVSNGAGVGAALSIVLGLSSVFITVNAFIMGLITVVLTVVLTHCFARKSSSILLLSGIIIGGLMSSVLSIIKYAADAETQLSDITYWLMGSFHDSTMRNAYILGTIVIVCSFILVVLRYRINVLGLGKEEAETKGINYSLYRYLIIGIATLLTASTVAFSGTISWIGLVIPHIIRLLAGKETYKTIPTAIPFGGAFMIIVDILSRSFTKSEVPLSAITGLFGTIVIIIIILIRRSQFNESY